MGRYLLALPFLLVGCVGAIDGVAKDDDGTVVVPGQPDAGQVVQPTTPDAGSDPIEPTVTSVAPPGTVAGEKSLGNGATTVTLGTTQTIYRIEAEPAQHVAFVLKFTDASGVVMSVDRWTGSQVVELGTTNAGAGQRLLSVLDRSDRRTYWVRVKAGASAQATLTVTRTDFPDGAYCIEDCDRLIQMPLPNDPAVDGYDTDSGTIFRYWFGRRDLVMQIRNATHERAKQGKSPIFPYDFSQWDGKTPGVDVGSPRHASHDKGKDVDLSLYGTDGGAWWRSFCTTRSASGGRECTPGTGHGFDGYETALLMAPQLAAGRVTMCFLDRELIPVIVAGAKKANGQGLIDARTTPLYSDGRHIQHWPNHDNHIHVRVSIEPYNAKIDFEPPFQAP